MTYQEHKEKASSEKIVLAWIEPSQRLFSWSFHEGEIYSRQVAHYVSAVMQGGVELAGVAAYEDLSEGGQFWFDPESKTLYVWSHEGEDPSTVWTDVTYRLFFSNAPIDLPADMDAGREVPYDARIKKTSKFKAKFDSDQKGIALEGSGNIVFHNTDGYFASIYDKLVWENKRVVIYSYARDLDPSDNCVLFNGVITNKDFDDGTVTFTVKDFIYRLRTDLDLPVFSAEDGTLPDSLIGKSKRRIYGRVDGLLCQPISNMRTRYEAQTIGVDDSRTGTPITASLTQDSNLATVSSTDVHKDIVAGDQIVVASNTFKVKSLARIDIGLDTPKDVTVSRTSGTVARLAFTGIDTSGVTAGNHISLSVLSNASQDTKSKILGLFPIAVVNSSYLEFTLPTSIASLSDTFKTGVGEIAVTRHTNTTTISLQQASEVTVASENITVQPVRAYRRFNRQYLVAHHALSTRETTITGVISAVKFSLESVDGIYEDDLVRINGTNLTTIVGLDRQAKQIIVADVVLPLPTLGNTVDRLGVQRVTYKEKDFTQFTDFNPAFDSELGAYIQFDYLAEFNAADTETFPSKLSWRNTSKQVLGSNNVFRDIQPRDWVKVETDSDWYEVAEKFSDNLIILNTPYTGSTAEATTLFKRPTFITDNAKIIGEVYGKTTDGTESGQHISTAAEIVKDLLVDSGLSAYVNDEAFEQASETAPFRIGLALPYQATGNSPKVRDVLNLLNDSVVGSLYADINGELCYKVLSAARKLDTTRILSDDDIINYNISGDSTKILRKVLVRFAPRDADTVTEAETYSVEQAESKFIENSGIDGQVETLQTAIYLRDDAQVMAQRNVFINELSKSQISVNVKLQLADAVLNDLITLDLARMYARLGTEGGDTSKTGLIQAIEKDGLNVRAVVDDLGNIFNRVAVIAPTDAPNYAEATETERRYAGYITDSNGIVDDDEDTFNANLIG